ncbi:MAG TPA: hypothetical protein VJJ81_02260 [Candidatus Babeliales bacterium]|nr:hypothetical protein [Candidatus Babeliales bacterium]
MSKGLARPVFSNSSAVHPEFVEGPGTASSSSSSAVHPELVEGPGTASFLLDLLQTKIIIFNIDKHL